MTTIPDNVARAMQRVRLRTVRELRQTKDGKKRLVKTLAEIAKQFGDDVLAPIKLMAERHDVQCVSTGFQELDDIISGVTERDGERRIWVAGSGRGLPRSRIVEVYGPESSGKTTLALTLIKSYQERGLEAGFIDVEHALDMDYAERIGCDIDNWLYSQGAESAEDTLGMVIKLVKASALDIIVVDSVAALTPQAEIDGDVGDYHVGVHARLMSQACRKLNAVLKRDHRCTVVLLNQTRCIDRNALVFTGQGLISASQAVQQKCEKIAGIDGTLTAIGNHAKSKQPSVKILAEDGHSLVCGKRHPFLRMAETGRTAWTAASELKAGDWVALARMPQLIDVPFERLPEIQRHRLDLDLLPEFANEEFCTFLGMWHSDGSLIDTEKIVGFTERSSERMDALLNCALNLGFNPRRCGVWIVQFGVAVYRLLDALGCERGRLNKSVPRVITGYLQWRAFLKGMFDSHVVKHGFNLTFESASAGYKAQIALQGLGIASRVTTRDTTVYLNVSGRDAAAYAEEVGFSEKTKATMVHGEARGYSENARGKADVIPFGHLLVPKIQKQRTAWKQLPTAMKARFASIKSMKLNMSFHDYEEVLRLCNLPDWSAYRWVKVCAVIPGKSKKMVDFDVPDGEAFVANGFVTHNSKIGVRYGNPETTTGGNALKFYATVRIRTSNMGEIKSGGEKGMRSKVRVVKTKIAVPFGECFIDITGGNGITRAYSTDPRGKEKKEAKDDDEGADD